MAAVIEDQHAAKLAKLKAETELIEAQTRKTRAENDHRLQIEIQKSIAETDKIRAETRWYPLVAVSAIVTGALAVVVAVIFKLIRNPCGRLGVDAVPRAHLHLRG
jgi:hypothetical protein